MPLCCYAPEPHYAEQTWRAERTRQTLLKLAALPGVKTLEQYDFGCASGTPRSQLLELGAVVFNWLILTQCQIHLGLNP